MEEFYEYVMSFYGPGQIWADFFDPSPTVEEIKEATRVRMSKAVVKNFPWGEGDSLDREIVRDIMLFRRGVSSKDLEYHKVISLLQR